MRRVLVIAVLIAAAGVALWVAWPQIRGRYDASRNPASASQPAASKSAAPRRAIIALGTIEPENGVIHVGSPLIGYRIAKIHVREGQRVGEGTLLAELDDAAAQAELRVAEAQLAEARERQATEVQLAQQKVAAAELALQQLTESRPLQLKAQQSLVEVAAANVRQAEREQARIARLRELDEPLVGEAQVEQQQLVLEAARAEYAAAETNLRRLEQSLEFQQRQAEAELTSAQLALSLAEKGTGIESIERRVDIARLQLQQTRILAPMDAVVLTVAAHPGELVAQQPILQLADLQHLTCVAEVEASDVSAIAPGHKAIIRSRALGEHELGGQVERIGSLVAEAQLRPLDPRAPIDRSVVKVVIDIPPEQIARLASHSPTDHRSALVGLQVEVELPLATSSPADNNTARDDEQHTAAAGS